MIIKIISICCVLGASSLSYAVDSNPIDENPDKKNQPKTASNQNGQNNIKFRDVDFDNKMGAGDNKKNKNKNKGGKQDTEVSGNSGCNIF